MAGELHTVPAFVAGLLIAGGVHTAKSVARPAVTAATGGMANWLVSLLEDLLSLIIVVLAILVPLLVLLLIAAVCFSGPGAVSTVRKPDVRLQEGTGPEDRPVEHSSVNYHRPSILPADKSQE